MRIESELAPPPPIRPAAGRSATPAAAGDREAVVELYRRHVSVGQARLAALMNLPVEVRSAGCRVWTSDGEVYLDCGGYGVFLLGHCHPRVVAAVREQLERHPLSTRMLLNRELAMAAEALAAVAPAGLDTVCFTGSGAEAVEAALKLARLHGKRRLISMRRGFHGKTLGALSVTGRPALQGPFAPLLPDVASIPFGDLEALAEALADARGEACVILEPVQAEGGVRIPPPGYLSGVRALTREHDALLIVDEVQTGLGRLGCWWGSEASGIVPDVLLTGKALSGGVVPIGAMIATREVFAPLGADPFLHSSTFGGSPLATAAAAAAIAVLREEDLIERSRELGETLLPELARALAPLGADRLVEVRGRGLLLGIELATPGLAAELILALLRRRVVVCHSLGAHRVVRLTPPALLAPDERAWLLAAVAAAARELAERPRPDGEPLTECD